MNEHKPKQLNLKDAEIYALAAELARLHGETLSGAVKAALREKLARDRRTMGIEERYAALMALAGSYKERAGPRTMSDEDAVGYDAFGAPN